MSTCQGPVIFVTDLPATERVEVESTETGDTQTYWALQECDTSARYQLIVRRSGTRLCDQCAAQHRSMYGGGYLRYGWQIRTLPAEEAGA